MRIKLLASSQRISKNQTQQQKQQNHDQKVEQIKQQQLDYGPSVSYSFAVQRYLKFDRGATQSKKDYFDQLKRKGIRKFNKDDPIPFCIKSDTLIIFNESTKVIDEQPFSNQHIYRAESDLHTSASQRNEKYTGQTLKQFQQLNYGHSDYELLRLATQKTIDYFKTLNQELLPVDDTDTQAMTTTYVQDNTHTFENDNTYDDYSKPSVAKKSLNKHASQFPTRKQLKTSIQLPQSHLQDEESKIANHKNNNKPNNTIISSLKKRDQKVLIKEENIESIQKKQGLEKLNNNTNNCHNNLKKKQSGIRILSQQMDDDSDDSDDSESEEYQNRQGKHRVSYDQETDQEEEDESEEAEESDNDEDFGYQRVKNQKMKEAQALKDIRAKKIQKQQQIQNQNSHKFTTNRDNNQTYQQPLRGSLINIKGELNYCKTPNILKTNNQHQQQPFPPVFRRSMMGNYGVNRFMMNQGNLYNNKPALQLIDKLTIPNAYNQFTAKHNQPLVQFNNITYLSYKFPEILKSNNLNNDSQSFESCQFQLPKKVNGLTSDSESEDEIQIINQSIFKASTDNKQKLIPSYHSNNNNNPTNQYSNKQPLNKFISASTGSYPGQKQPLFHQPQLKQPQQQQPHQEQYQRYPQKQQQKQQQEQTAYQLKRNYSDSFTQNRKNNPYYNRFIKYYKQQPPPQSNYHQHGSYMQGAWKKQRLV